MELFKKFDKTIFYKQDNELEYQIKALKKINAEFPSNDKIRTKVKTMRIRIKR